MSKRVKELLTQDLSHRLEGVTEALIVNVVGLDANRSVVLRKQLREKNMHLMVVRNSLARRATEGTPLAPALATAEGTLAVMWGGDDIVSLAKEAVKLQKDAEFKAFEARGGVMDGEALSSAQVQEISKWPSREEQLSMLVGQILSPGGGLAGCLIGPSGALASQIEKKSKD